MSGLINSEYTSEGLTTGSYFGSYEWMFCLYFAGCWGLICLHTVHSSNIDLPWTPSCSLCANTEILRADSCVRFSIIINASSFRVWQLTLRPPPPPLDFHCLVFRFSDCAWVLVIFFSVLIYLRKSVLTEIDLKANNACQVDYCVPNKACIWLVRPPDACNFWCDEKCMFWTLL